MKNINLVLSSLSYILYSVSSTVEELSKKSPIAVYYFSTLLSSFNYIDEEIGNLNWEFDFKSFVGRFKEDDEQYLIIYFDIDFDIDLTDEDEMLLFTVYADQEGDIFADLKYKEEKTKSRLDQDSVAIKELKRILKSKKVL